MRKHYKTPKITFDLFPLCTVDFSWCSMRCKCYSYSRLYTYSTAIYVAWWWGSCILVAGHIRLFQTLWWLFWCIKCRLVSKSTLPILHQCTQTEVVRLCNALKNLSSRKYDSNFLYISLDRLHSTLGDNKL